MATLIRPVGDDLPDADRAQLVACLTLWRTEGQANPVIPCDVDVDGDGIVDGYGLGPSGELVYVSGVAIADTVFEATGGGVENPAEAAD